MGKLTDVQKIEICERYNSGESAWQIAKYYPVASQSIYSLLKRRGVQLRSASDRKLNDEQRRELCQKYKDGESSYKLAEEYGLVANYVQRLIKSRGIKARGPRKYFYDVDFFDSIDCEMKAYWLGVLYADGHVHKDGLSLGMVDREHIEKFREAISATYPIEKEDRKTKNKNHQDMFNLRISDRSLPSKLEKLGLVPRKSKIIRFPNIKENFKRSFILGFFDGDGYFTTSHPTPKRTQWQIGITSGSCDFLHDVRDFIRAQLSFNNGCISRNHKTCWQLSFNGNRVAPKVANWMYERHSCRLDRKYEKYCEMMDMIEVLNVD